MPPFASFPIVLCRVLLLGACSDAADRNDLIVITGPTMGATYAAKLYDSNGDTDTLQPQSDDLLERINDQMSTWRPASELSKFNRSPDHGWFPVSAQLAHVVETPASISALSGGAFDTSLWIFPPSPKVLPWMRSLGRWMRGTFRRTWWRSVVSCVPAAPSPMDHLGKWR